VFRFFSQAFQVVRLAAAFAFRLPKLKTAGLLSRNGSLAGITLVRRGYMRSTGILLISSVLAHPKISQPVAGALYSLSRNRKEDLAYCLYSLLR